MTIRSENQPKLPPRPSPETITFPVGVNTELLAYGIVRPVMITPFNPPHMCICGASGSGKTFTERQVLGRIAQDPANLIVFADYKGIDFPEYIGCKHYYRHNAVGNALELVVRIMNYRMAHPEASYLPLFFVFDEWSGFLSSLDKKAQDEAKKALSSLLMLSRGASIALVLCMQRIDASNFGSSRDNIGTILALGQLSQEARRMIDADHKEMLTASGRGRGVLVTDGKLPVPVTIPDVRDMKQLNERIIFALNREIPDLSEVNDYDG